MTVQAASLKPHPHLFNGHSQTPFGYDRSSAAVANLPVRPSPL